MVSLSLSVLFSAAIAAAALVSATPGRPSCLLLTHCYSRHCQTFAPKYEAAAKTLREQNIDVKLAKIDCQRFSTFCQDYMIRAFPTLKIFKEGRELYHEYDGPRRSSA